MSGGAPNFHHAFDLHLRMESPKYEGNNVVLTLDVYSLLNIKRNQNTDDDQNTIALILYFLFCL